MAINWTPELINQCKKILNQHSDLNMAIDDMEKASGQTITYNKLRHAFERNKLGRPQCHLNKEKLANSLGMELELGTRQANKGGLGKSESLVVSQMEDRLGITLDDLDENLRDEMKAVSTQIINENTKKKSLLREARSRMMMEERLTNLTTTFLKTTKSLSQPFDRFEIRPDNKDHSQDVLLVCMADVHVGKKWIDRDGIVRCDKQIIRERVMEITSDAIEVIKQRNISKVVLWWAGDIFETPLGNMRKNQQAKMDLIGKEAFAEAKNLVINQALDIIREVLHMVDIEILLTGGNHDRLTEEKEYSSEDFMMYMFGDSIKSTLPSCDVRVLPPVASVEVHETELLLLHGHRNKLANEMAIRRLVENQGRTDKPKLILQGHYHNYRALSGRKWDCITLPAVCGCDDFVQYDINQYSEARYCMFVIEPDQYFMIGPKKLKA